MIRNIILKGYCKEKDKWIFGKLIQCKNGTRISEIKGFENRKRGEAIILGHFEGVSNEDETEVYEGNILIPIPEHTIFPYDYYPFGEEPIYIGYKAYDDNIGQWRVYIGEYDAACAPSDAIRIYCYDLGHEVIGTKLL